jgi:hypothetical protein
MSTRETATMPPAAARWLGGFGLLPFIGASATASLAGDLLGMQALTALIAYGSVILSFIGGAHWGFAGPHLNGPLAKPARTILALSVVPSLVGWAALLLPTPWSLSVLATAFVGVLAAFIHELTTPCLRKIGYSRFSCGQLFWAHGPVPAICGV